MIKSVFIFLLTCTFFYLSSLLPAYGQINNLRQFALKKNADWKQKKLVADSIAKQHNMPIIQIGKNFQVKELQRFEHGLPVYYQTENIIAAATISANKTWEDSGFSPGLSGLGMIAGIWDAGYVLTTHEEFNDNTTSRVILHDQPSYLGTHVTHLSGSMIARGINAQSRGMANSGRIYAYDFNNDLAEMASEACDGLQVSNHSYGPICGWSYNSAEEMWYWHGDISISTTEEIKFGLYTDISHDLDHLSYLAPEYLIIKSAGNDRNDAPSSQPTEHFIWDEHWILSQQVHDPDGGIDGYDCLSPMAIAKNILTVGAVEDVPTGYTSPSEVSITAFSSWGPTDDGRIKPDLVANGTTILSCGPGEDEYLELSGSSMAAATISGSILLLNELQATLQSGVKLKSSTIKGLLIHTADECGQADGPDYQFGWGLANMYKAATLMKKNHSNGGRNITEAILNEGEIKTISIDVPENTPFLKATICWTDPPGNVAPYELNGSTSNLVNNLDIVLVETATQQMYYPWKLDPSNPSQASTKGVNNIDIVEQAFINTPAPGNYTVKISHQGDLANHLQAFSLIITGIEVNESAFPPQELSFTTNDNEVKLFWEVGLSQSASNYNIYRDEVKVGSSTFPTYIDQTVQNGNMYTYKVTAMYGTTESMPTNAVFAKPLKPKSMPYLMNCESGLEDWQLKADISGWRLGDSDSMNCYYLHFDDNTGHFFGIDSYTAGEGLHVSDIAISPTINMANYENIVLSFDYLLVTGIYGTINELEIKYRLNEASEWISVSNLGGASDWKHVQFSVPQEAAVSGCQFGFFYDDFYKWGMGAGVDNIQLDGTLNIQEDLSLENISSPVSQICLNENPLNLSVTLKNTGTTTIPASENIDISILCNGIQKIKNYVLTQNLNPGTSLNISFQNQIDPLPAGNHELSVEITWAKDQNASNNSKTKTIVVNNLPVITFIDPPEIVCKNSDAVILNAIPEGGIFEGEYVTGKTFDPSLATVGTHDIIYSYTYINACTNSKTIFIDVAPLPEVSFTGLSPQYCLNNPAEPLVGTPSGGSFSGAGMLGNSFTPALAGPGSHPIEYFFTDQNGCSNTNVQSTIVFDLPTVSIINLEEAYCQNSETVTLNGYPAGGTFYVNDEIHESFIPNQYAPGPIEILYSYQDQNGCLSTTSETIDILGLPEVTIVDPGDPFCITTTSISLLGNPIGGIFSGTSLTGNIFDPSDAGIGAHEIMYSYIDINSCTSADTILVEVVPLPVVSFSGLMSGYCPDDDNVQLMGVPSGGTFSGVGIQDDYFSPQVAGSGVYTITYDYTDENGCNNSITQETSIFDQTPVEILNLKDSYCEYENQITLLAIPEGGVFYIDGEVKKDLVPSVLGAGNVSITYEYIDANSCSSSENKLIDILETPLVTIEGLNELYCPVNENFYPAGTPEGGNFILNENIISSFNPVALGEGNYELLYEYMDIEGCTGSTSQSFEITSNPTLYIEGLNSSYCPDAEPALLKGVPGGGYFLGDGISENIFSPQSISPGTYSISYVYELNGCEAQISTSTMVTNPVQVSIENLLDFYCPLDSLAGITGIPAGGIFSVKSNTQDIPGFMSYELIYTYSDEYNCEFSEISNFKIVQKPDYPLPETLELTELDTITVELENMDLLFYWENGTTSNSFEIIGSSFPSGWNSMPLMFQDDLGCINDYTFVFFIDGPNGIPEDPNTFEFTLYPNPTNDYLNIEIQVQSDVNLTLTFFDLHGKISSYWEGEGFFVDNKGTLDVREFSPGIYLLSISGENFSLIKKFVIQR